MKTLSYLFFILLAGLFTLNLHAQPSHSPHTILVFGDSLSAGYGLQPQEEWPSLLQKKLAINHSTWKVSNLSISGETTQGGLLRFEKAIMQYQPNIIIIELGANDGLRGQSLKAMYDNLEKMIQLSHTLQATVLLAGMHIPPNYGKRYTQAFHQVYLTLQKKYNLAFIPFLLSDVAGEKTLLLKDDLHPNAKGQVLILKNVWNYLKPLLHHPK